MNTHDETQTCDSGATQRNRNALQPRRVTMLSLGLRLLLPSTSSLSEFPIECLQLSTDERTIGLATNSILKVVDITTGHESRNLTGHTLPITSLSASKFSPYCWYTGSSDCTWTQWDTRMHQSKIYGSKTSGVVRSLALSPGDHYVAIGTDDNIQIFDARQRDIIKQFNCSGHTLELHPSDVLLSAVGHDRIVRFFCLENFELISQSDPFLDDIQASAFDSEWLTHRGMRWESENAPERTTSYAYK
uniref:WD repeat-containing protein 55 homolog n=1 Tax=Caenorhabditis japonica TaxID=281687 RepID=A0A8R1EBI8_CAEJA